MTEIWSGLGGSAGTRLGWVGFDCRGVLLEETGSAAAQTHMQTVVVLPKA